MAAIVNAVLILGSSTGTCRSCFVFTRLIPKSQHTFQPFHYTNVRHCMAGLEVPARECCSKHFLIYATDAKLFLFIFTACVCAPNARRLTLPTKAIWPFVKILV